MTGGTDACRLTLLPGEQSWNITVSLDSHLKSRHDTVASKYADKEGTDFVMSIVVN